MTLTQIAMTKRGRVALYADGAFVMSLHPDVFAASGISVGSQIDEDALRELSDAAELREARERALSMLSRQDYTARGLRDRLTRHVSEEAAGQAVERMQELGLIDDERYAARFAQELLERRHYGAARSQLFGSVLYRFYGNFLTLLVFGHNVHFLVEVVYVDGLGYYLFDVGLKLFGSRRRRLYFAVPQELGSLIPEYRHSLLGSSS